MSGDLLLQTIEHDPNVVGAAGSDDEDDAQLISRRRQMIVLPHMQFIKGVDVNSIVS